MPLPDEVAAGRVDQARKPDQVLAGNPVPGVGQRLAALALVERTGAVRPYRIHAVGSALAILAYRAVDPKDVRLARPFDIVAICEKRLGALPDAG